MTRITLAAILCATVTACAQPCYTSSGLYVSPSICEAYKAREAERAARIEAGKTAPAKPTTGPPLAGDDDTETLDAPRATREPALKPYTVQTIRDQHGIRQGALEQRPDGEVVIKDKWGVRRGTIAPQR